MHRLTGLTLSPHYGASKLYGEALAQLKKAVSDAEADLARLQVVLTAIDRAMFDPAAAANEYAALTMGELAQRRGKIVAAQEAAEAEWLAANEALERASEGALG